MAANTTDAELEAALLALKITIGPVFHTDKKRHFASLLTRRLLRQNIDHFDCFKRTINSLISGSLLEKVEALFKHIRSLWVDPGAAGAIPCALNHKRPLALNGKLLTYADPFLETRNFTLERYIERAWIGSKCYLPVPVDSTITIVQVKNEIRAGIWGSLKFLPPGIQENDLDRVINQDLRVIVLFVHSPNPEAGIPDPRFLGQLIELHQIYNKLIIILQSGENIDSLPDSVKAVLPPLDPTTEIMALGGERSTRTFLDQKYGISR